MKKDINNGNMPVAHQENVIETAEQYMARVQDRTGRRVQLGLVIAGVVFIIIMLVKQGNRDRRLYETALRAKVILVQKGYKGYDNVTLTENGKRRYIDFDHAKESIIEIGDSIYKKAGSDLYFIKKDTMKEFVALDLKDASIGKKWD